MIKTVEEAFQVLDTQAVGIPYDAIEFLRNQGTTPLMTQKLVHGLSNAYNGEVFYSQKDQVMLPAPLWYAVVAEKHLTKELFTPVLNLFTVEEDWDLMNEQGVLLVGLLGEKFTGAFVDSVLDFVEENIKENNKKPYLLAFEALYFAQDNQMERIYSLLNREHFHWVDHYIRILGDLQREDSLPVFKSLVSFFEGKHALVELNYYIEILEGKHPEFEAGIPFSKMRGEDWRAHYSQMEFIFAKSESPLVTSPKVGRNDLCPCGSGKKYKHCCLN